MPKPKITFLLLFAWIFALCVPPLATVLQSDESGTLISVNLNEEEQNEQGKKQIDSEHIAIALHKHLWLLQSQGSDGHEFYLAGHANHNAEVVLPPPENG